jgi:hypothetical protein
MLFTNIKDLDLRFMNGPVKDLFHIKRLKDAIAEQAADCKGPSKAWNVFPFIG